MITGSDDSYILGPFPAGHQLSVDVGGIDSKYCFMG